MFVYQRVIVIWYLANASTVTDSSAVQTLENKELLGKRFFKTMDKRELLTSYMGLDLRLSHGGFPVVNMVVARITDIVT